MNSLALLLSTLTMAAGQANDTARPNIVLIMADDLGYGDVAYNGGPFPTPHLDRLAKEGVRLDQHYSYPVCSPTRASLLTGRYPSRFGCTSPQNNRVLPFDTITLAAALRSVGYRTALVGKWHLGSRPDWGPQIFGFDHSYGSLAGGVAPYNHRYKMGEFSQTWHRNGKLIEEEGHVTDLLTQEAVRFIAQKRAGPFFLYVPYTAVHLPIDEPKQWLEVIKDAKDEGTRHYGACIAHMDDGVGQIVAALKKAGQLDHTLIIFLSDNGGSRAQNFDNRYPGTYPMFLLPGRNFPFRGFKGTLYEGGIRTPALARWPRRLPARPLPAPIHVADWFPTLASLTGYQAKANLKWDGQNVWPVLTGETKNPPPRTLYWLASGGTTALRHGDWVLIEKKKGPPELFNLAQDPEQKTNLAEREPQRVAELQRLRASQAQADNDAKVKE